MVVSLFDHREIWIDRLFVMILLHDIANLGVHLIRRHFNTEEVDLKYLICDN